MDEGLLITCQQWHPAEAATRHTPLVGQSSIIPHP
jgi:hypothetical protein